MTLEEKAIKLADFWYNTDFYNFKNNFEGIEDAINQAKKCIETDFDRTIKIIMQDISEIEDDEFTKQANEIIEIISNGVCNADYLAQIACFDIGKRREKFQWQWMK